MRLDKKYKIEEAAAGKKEDRDISKSILIEDTKAIATNGKILAMVPVQTEEETGNSIKALDLKFQRSNPKSKGSDSVFATLEPLGGQFPNYKVVFPEGQPEFIICIDVALLVRLSKALGSEVVQLEFHGSDRSFKVLPYDIRNTAEGIMLPIKPRK